MLQKLDRHPKYSRNCSARALLCKDACRGKFGRREVKVRVLAPTPSAGLHAEVAVVVLQTSVAGTLAAAGVRGGVCGKEIAHAAVPSTLSLAPAALDTVSLFQKEARRTPKAGAFGDVGRNDAGLAPGLSVQGIPPARLTALFAEGREA